MRRAGRIFIAVLIGVVLGMLWVTDNALRAPPRFLPPLNAADELARNTGSAWQHSQVTARDGAALDGWQFTPRDSNGSVVILLHGVGDTRLGMLGHATFLLRSGFTVLLPDIRGHG